MCLGATFGLMSGSQSVEPSEASDCLTQELLWQAGSRFSFLSCVFPVGRMWLSRHLERKALFTL